MSKAKVVRVGSRKSELALIQTNTIIKRLKEKNPDLDFQLVTMETIGDKILDAALSKIGEKNLFTRELETALENKDVDFVVHSLKDLPTVVPDGLVIGCVYKRDSPYDAIVMHPSHMGKKLDDLPEGSVIGTSSVRRSAQMTLKYPTFKFENIRGNLNTRLRKLDTDNKYDAIILAEAGLVRMGWHDRISEVLNKEKDMYAVSQGAMAVECRAGDDFTLKLLSQIHDHDTTLQCVAERAFLKKLEGGCSVPVSTFSEVKNDKIFIKGGVFSLDASKYKIVSVTKELNKTDEPSSSKKVCIQENDIHYAGLLTNGQVSPEDMKEAEDAGIDLANMILESDAATILSDVKAQMKKEIVERHKKQMLQKQAERAKIPTQGISTERHSPELSC